MDSSTFLVSYSVRKARTPPRPTADLPVKAEYFVGVGWGGCGSGLGDWVAGGVQGSDGRAQSRRAERNSGFCGNSRALQISIANERSLSQCVFTRISQRRALKRSLSVLLDRVLLGDLARSTNTPLPVALWRIPRPVVG